MKFLYLIAIFLLVSCAGLEKAQKQSASREAEAILTERTPFMFTYGSYAGDSLFSRLDIYIRIRFADLVFEKSNNGFIAHYEISFDFYKLPTYEYVRSDSWEDTLTVANYNETQKENRGVQFLQRYNEMLPGRYELRIMVTDLNIPTGTNYQTKTMTKVVIARNYQNNFSLSDIMLVDKIDKWDKNGRAVEATPSFFASATKDSLLSFYFEIYNLKTSVVAKIFYQIMDENGKRILDDSLSANVLYPTFSHLLNVTMRDIPNGTYLLNVSVWQDSSYFFQSVYFGFYYWLSADLAIRNLDEAIRQLRYIVPDKELKKMKVEQGKEKEKLFLEYWKRRDPSPVTPENELMEEYYSRVETANKSFRFANRPGWETDRGMVYIVLGMPDDIYRQTMSQNMRNFEVWTYWNIKRRRLTFVFVDRYGVGDYYLTEPFDPFRPVY